MSASVLAVLLYASSPTLTEAVCVSFCGSRTREERLREKQRRQQPQLVLRNIGPP